ncbi:MAG TPA: calcium-binding protein [Allosphingosinicella sp.]
MAYFSFTDASNETFVIRVTDRDDIAHARALLAGTTTDAARVGGTIIKVPADYNIGWSYKLAPDSIMFYDASIEVADSTMRYIETHLSEVGGHLLPGRQWAGWSTTLTSELTVRSGSWANDILHGQTEVDDLMFGRGGNDILFSYGGNDHLSGGDGNDILKAARGDDKLGGGDGNDILEADWGDDFLHGGRGSDVLIGGGGDDVFLAGRFSDCDRDVIADFEGGRQLEDQIRFDRTWLREIGDVNDDGRVNRRDIAAAFEEKGEDLVLDLRGSSITLENAAGTQLHVNDFLIG